MPRWAKRPALSRPPEDDCGTGPICDALSLARSDLFDAAWYVSEYSDVAGSGVEPLQHYCEFGWREGRKPAPQPPPEWRGGLGCNPLVHLEVGRSGLFDPNFYLVANGDVRRDFQDPLTHFCIYGLEEDRSPNPYFETAWYRGRAGLPRNPNCNPLLHYARIGEADGLKPGPHFDPAWYRERYELCGNHSPLAHFLAHRRGQRHSPNPDFDVLAYLSAHGKQMGTGRDPFMHSLLSSRAESLPQIRRSKLKR